MVASNNAINNTVGAAISGVTNTLTVTNGSNTASSAAQMLITVGGTSSGNPWLQWTVGTTESFALGMNNSASQKLYLNYNASASVSPTTGTNMFIYDHTIPGIVHAAGAFNVFNTSASAVGTSASNGVSKYEKGTYTPTVVGQGTAGTTTYTTQTGSYVRLDNWVYCHADIVASAATGSGACLMGGLPFTSNNTTDDPLGAGRVGGTALNWQTRTCTSFRNAANATTGRWQSGATAQAGAFIQIGNSSQNHRYSVSYRI